MHYCELMGINNMQYSMVLLVPVQKKEYHCFVIESLYIEHRIYCSITITSLIYILT